jgi:hypothetical protein
MTLRRALTNYESSCGSVHPNSAGTLNNRGSVLQDLGEPNGAR